MEFATVVHSGRTLDCQSRGGGFETHSSHKAVVRVQFSVAAQAGSRRFESGPSPIYGDGSSEVRAPAMEDTAKWLATRFEPVGA